MYEYCCKHCPTDCQTEHDTPPERDCADCIVEHEVCYANALAV